MKNLILVKKKVRIWSFWWYTCLKSRCLTLLKPGISEKQIHKQFNWEQKSTQLKEVSEIVVQPGVEPGSPDYQLNC